MSTYKLTLTIETEARHTRHALNRVKRAIQTYQGAEHVHTKTEMKVSAIDCTKVNTDVTIFKGARWSADLWCEHMLVRLSSTAWVLTGLDDGETWDTRPYGSAQEAVRVFEETHATWTLVSRGDIDTGETIATWGGKVSL